MADVFAKTPKYVLHEGPCATGPSFVPISSQEHDVVIFGFSDKPAYDLFLAGSSRALKPYPLVKGFLKNQSELHSGSLMVVVLDAASPTASCHSAATFQSVLESLQLGLDSVAVSHRLISNEASSEYRLEELSLSSSAKSLS